MRQAILRSVQWGRFAGNRSELGAFTAARFSAAYSTLYGLIFWLNGNTDIDPRPPSRFRMNLELSTHQACTFSHASDAQTHSIHHLLRVESTPFVTHAEK